MAHWEATQWPSPPTLEGAFPLGWQRPQKLWYYLRLCPWSPQEVIMKDKKDYCGSFCGREYLQGCSCRKRSETGKGLFQRLFRTLACMLSLFSCVRLFVIPWSVARQVPLSMEFFRQEYWSELPCPPPGDLPDQGIQCMSLISPALAGRFFITSTTQEALQDSQVANKLQSIPPTGLYQASEGLQLRVHSTAY